MIFDSGLLFWGATPYVVSRKQFVQIWLSVPRYVVRM